MRIHYQKKLKVYSKKLRINMTDAERVLWSRLRRKQIDQTQFYRQKPVGKYIVDFYAPKAKLVIEVDGGQHFEPEHLQYDQERDSFLRKLNLKVLRFNNSDVLRSTEGVMEIIFNEVHRRRNPLPR